MEKLYNLLRSWYLEEAADRKNPESKDTEEKTYKVHEVNGQLNIILPKILATAVDIKSDDKVLWKIKNGELVLCKSSR